jgi:tetratricopeptide (TPR) repeat protein
MDCGKFATVFSGGRMRKSLVLLILAAFLPCGALFASGETAADNYKKANALFASAHYNEALPLYKSILSSPSEKIPAGDVYTRIGDSYYRLGSYQNAIHAYQGALARQDRAAQPGTRYWIGFCNFLLGRHDQAAIEFLKIPELHPEAGMWVGTAYYWAGRSCERLGRKDLALQYYKKAGGNGKSTQGRFAMKKAEKVQGQVARGK